MRQDRRHTDLQVRPPNVGVIQTPVAKPSEDGADEAKAPSPKIRRRLAI
jgi:hypothetical protein